MKNRLKICCVSFSSIGKRLFERFGYSPGNFIQLIQSCPRERGSLYLQFSFQRPGDLFYLPHLLAHAVLSLDTIRQQFYQDEMMFLQQIKK